MKLKTTDNVMYKRIFRTAQLVLCFIGISIAQTSYAQIQWTPDGESYYSFSEKGIEVVHLLDPDKNELFLSQNELIPSGQSSPLRVQSFAVSPDGNTLLLF